MSLLKSGTNRYTDQELEIFKILIEQKLEKARKELLFMRDQIDEIAEVMEGEGDLMDDISNSGDIEMLQTMAHRHRHYIRDLENALLRIGNRTYGICTITGELIDKRRLMAVPTTTKSLAAKMELANPTAKKEVRVPAPQRKGAVTSFTRVVRKSTPVQGTQPKVSQSDFDDEGPYYDDEDQLDEAFDLDSLVDEDTIE